MSENSLKIAFDAKRLFHNREGLGSYARTLVRMMAGHVPHHAIYLCSAEEGGNAYAQDFKGSPYNIISPSQKVSAGYWRSKGMVKDLKRTGVEIYWGLSNELPHGLAKSGIKSILTIHDLFYKTHPAQFRRVDRWILARKYAHAVKAADLIYVPSHHTREDLLRFFPEAQPKVKVLYQSVSAQYKSRVVVRSENPSYFLSVGAITPRKNYELLIRAYEAMPAEDRVPLKIVGRKTKHQAPLESAIQRKELSKWISFHNEVSDVALASLYTSAIALIQTSHYEGFGIPVLEALTAGTAVIAQDTSSLPEVVGKHGIIFEYDDVEALVDGMKVMKSSEFRKNLLQDVDVHLRKFDAEVLVEQIMTDIRSLIAKTGM